jgi:hypothetical protein
MGISFGPAIEIVASWICSLVLSSLLHNYQKVLSSTTVPSLLLLDHPIHVLLLTLENRICFGVLVANLGPVVLLGMEQSSKSWSSKGRSLVWILIADSSKWG